MTSGAAIERRLVEVTAPERVSVEQAALQASARDYHWFSDILEEELRGKVPDVVCTPATTAELADVLAVAYDERVPVTPRAGGTGNYGQRVPLRGGVALSMRGLDQVLEVGDGRARVEPGATFAIARVGVHDDDVRVAVPVVERDPDRVAVRDERDAGVGRAREVVGDHAHVARQGVTAGRPSMLTRFFSAT